VDAVGSQPPTEDDVPDLRDSVRRYEAIAIAEALKANGGNRTRAAVALGLSRRTLQEKIARYGLGRAARDPDAAAPEP
jgi:DNA-binding NtrC family response regulator